MIPREIFEQTILGFFEPIRPFLDDASVSEVMINGPEEIWIERKGRLSKTDARFSSHEALMSALRNLSERSALLSLSLPCPSVPRWSRDLGASSADVSPWCRLASARDRHRLPNRYFLCGGYPP